MLRNVLGLDINEDLIAGVLVSGGGLKKRQVVDGALVSIQEAGSIHQALTTLLDRLAVAGAACCNGIPSDRISYRNLVMPFRQEKKIRQTIAFELETLLPYPVDDLIVDFNLLKQEAGKSQVLAAALKKNFLAGYLAILKSHDLDPELLDIRGVPLANALLKRPETPDSGILLDIGREKGTLVLFSGRKVALVRKLFASGITSSADRQAGEAEDAVAALCRTVLNTCHAFGGDRPAKVFVTGRGFELPGLAAQVGSCLELPVETVDLGHQPGLEMSDAAVAAWQPLLMNNALSLALHPGKREGFNFRRREFEYQRPLGGLKKKIKNGAIFLGLIILLLALDFGVGYYGLKKQYQALSARQISLFRQHFPETRKIVDPVQQMRSKISELKKNSFSLPGIGKVKVLDLLADISNRIPAGVDIQVARLIVDQEGLQLKGTTDTFNAVDNIKKNLEASDYFNEVVISSANLEKTGNRVQFDIRLHRRDRGI